MQTISFKVLITFQEYPSACLGVCKIFLMFCSFSFVESSSFNIKEFSVDQEKTNVFIFHLMPTSSRFVLW